jgi:hypothetical protein
MTVDSRLDDRRCRRGRRRSIGERLAEKLGLSRLKARRARRCEVRPDWLDDDGLQPASVPRCPRDPRPGGRVARELPELGQG